MKGTLALFKKKISLLFFLCCAYSTTFKMSGFLLNIPSPEQLKETPPPHKNISSVPCIPTYKFQVPQIFIHTHSFIFIVWNNTTKFANPKLQYRDKTHFCALLTPMTWLPLHHSNRSWTMVRTDQRGCIHQSQFTKIGFSTEKLNIVMLDTPYYLYSF